MKTSLSTLPISDRQTEHGGRIPRPFRRIQCQEAHKKHGVVCFDLDALNPDDRDWVRALAKATGHIGAGK